MKRLILYFTLLFLTALCGIAINKHSGYVLVAYGATTFETTLWFAIICMLLFFLVAYALLRCCNNMRHLPQMISNCCQKQHNLKTQRNFNDGIQKLLLGDWIKAEKKFQQNFANDVNNTALTQCANNAENRLIKIAIKNTPATQCNGANKNNANKKRNNLSNLNAYLAAAYAANKQQHYKQRDSYLDIAQQLYSGDKKIQFTISLCRLRLLLQNKQYDEALALLCYLQQNYRKYKKLLQKIQEQNTHLRNYNHQSNPQL